ncbi:MAG: DUF4432 family protein [Reyranellales bacterium]
MTRAVVGEGVQALVFSTGALDFAVLIDRSLDIGPLSWRCHKVGWESPAGFRHPAGHDPHADEGRGFDRLFSGFLVTGGLEHIRHPRDGHPLHGSLPFTPATLTASGEERGALFCEGEVSQPGFRLRRRIEAPVDGNSLAIVDTVENLAATPQRQASLYHFNIGQPTLADETIVKQGAERRLGPLRVPDPTMASESAGFLGAASCTVETPRCTITFAWDAATLPHLQLWHRLNAEPPVLSIEPCTSERLPAGLSGEEPILAPGAMRRYRLQVSFE